MAAAPGLRLALGSGAAFHFGRALLRGAAILVRMKYGLRAVDLRLGEAGAHRAVAGVIDLGQGASFSVASLYCAVSEGPSEANLDLVASVVQGLQGAGHQWLVGADWNMWPAALCDTGIAEQAAACVVATGRGTCKGALRRTELDYFLVWESLARGVASVRLRDERASGVHTPVELALRDKLPALKALVFDKARKWPVVPPFGPVPRPHPQWAVLAARMASASVHRHADADFHFTAWCKTAVAELSAVLGLPVGGRRGRPARLRWAPVLDRCVTKEAPPAVVAHAAAQWLSDKIAAAVLTGGVDSGEAHRWVRQFGQAPSSACVQHIALRGRVITSENCSGYRLLHSYAIDQAGNSFCIWAFGIDLDDGIACCIN